MRISTNQLTEVALSGISESYTRYAAAQRLVATGKRIDAPSDDPAGLARALSLRAAIEDIGQFNRNIDEARGFLGTTDNALAQAIDGMRQVRTLAIQAATDTVSPEMRSNLASQVRAVIDQLGFLGNATYGERYVFAGQRTTEPAFVRSADTFEYRGGSTATGDSDIIVEIYHRDTIVVNHTGDRLFAPAFEALEKTQNHIAGGQVTALSMEDVAAIDTVIRDMLAARAEAGARVQRIEKTALRINQASVTYSELLSKVEDADFGKAVVELSTAELTYQGALAAGAKSISQTLLDFLR